MNMNGLHLFLIFNLISFRQSFCQLENTTFLRSNGTIEEKIAAKRNFLESNQRLFNYLFDEYNNEVPPVYTRSRKATNSTPDRDQFLIILHYAKILDVINMRQLVMKKPKDNCSLALSDIDLVLQSPPKQLVTMIFEYTTIWRDDRLSWNPQEFDGINHMYVLRKRVWLPEVTPFDSSVIYGTRPGYTQHVEVLFFPFDKQNCSVKLLSYTFFPTEISLVSSIYTPGLPAEVGSEEWEVESITALSEMRFGENGTNATQVNEFRFLLKRNPSHYIYLIIIPSFILTLLSILGIFSSPSDEVDIAKFSMGLSTMMSTTVVISIVTDNIPKSKALPNICYFILMNLIIVGGANMAVVYIPKLGSWVRWCLRCRGVKNLRRLGGFFSFVINILALILFEFLAVWNLSLLMQGSRGFDATTR